MKHTRRSFFATIAAGIVGKTKPIEDLGAYKIRHVYGGCSWAEATPFDGVCNYSNHAGPPLNVENLKAALVDLHAILKAPPVVLTRPLYLRVHPRPKKRT